MKGDKYKTRKEVLDAFDSFAKRTNWFDNDIAKSNLRIFIEVICDDMWDEARNQCECSERFNKDFAVHDATSKLQ